MNLTLDLDLDILKMYMHTTNKIYERRLSKVRARRGQTDRQTHRHGRTYYHAALARLHKPKPKPTGLS